MMKKMGWGGAGLGTAEQGIQVRPNFRLRFLFVFDAQKKWLNEAFRRAGWRTVSFIVHRFYLLVVKRRLKTAC